MNYKARITMKVLNSVFNSILLLFLLTGCEGAKTDEVNNNTNNDVNNDDNKVEITISSEDWVTRSYSRDDLTEFEFKEGEYVAIVDDNGVNYKYQVGETIDSKTHLYNPDVDLIDGAKYRVQYPYPEGTDSGDFILSLGFGCYEGTPTLDWMVSGWKTYNNGKIHFNVKRLNSVAIFDIVAPFDCVVEQMRLSADDCAFCIKGAFNCAKEQIEPKITTWTSQYKFPHANMEWKMGEKYTYILTLWPQNYNKVDCTLDVYTTDKQGASATIDLKNMGEGEISEYTVDNFEILPSPVIKKDAKEVEKEGDKIVNVIEHEGEYY